MCRAEEAWQKSLVRKQNNITSHATIPLTKFSKIKHKQYTYNYWLRNFHRIGSDWAFCSFLYRRLLVVLAFYFSNSAKERSDSTIREVHSEIHNWKLSILNNGLKGEDDFHCNVNILLCPDHKCTFYLSPTLLPGQFSVFNTLKSTSSIIWQLQLPMSIFQNYRITSMQTFSIYFWSLSDKETRHFGTLFCSPISDLTFTTNRYA